MIREITLSGFRGVVHPLTLPLMKGGKPTSLMIFGRNGFGKSSITDGWEWFHTGTIRHLAREGAMAAAYPSRLPGGAAPAGFVEVVFHDVAAGVVRLPLAAAKGKQANKAGHDWFKSRAPHPCHIRYEDLGRFVYLKKTERFDELSSLMGFAAQSELLRSLRRVEGKLTDRLEAARRTLGDHDAAVARHFKIGAEGVSEALVLARFAGLFARHGISPIATWLDVARGTTELTARVEHDGRAAEMKDLAGFIRCLERLPVPEQLPGALDAYAIAATDFRAQERASVDTMLLGLYESGDAVLSRLVDGALAALDTCPLCGQHYDGDLLSHVRSELTFLSSLRAARDAAESARKHASSCLQEPEALARALRQGLADVGALSTKMAMTQLAASCDAVDRIVESLRAPMATSAESLTPETLAAMADQRGPLRSAYSALLEARSPLLVTARRRLAELEADEQRRKLVEDHGKAVEGRRLWRGYARARAAVAALTHCHDEYLALVERYVAMNLEDVEGRFAAISAHVDRYFGILEAYTPGVSHPALRLVRDQDRAVVLEVEFQGETVSPAYSYLSESQLNSFGLAVFLASVRHVNRDFRLLILDDVVNSFDAHKRPQLIKLLKQEFSDFQVIVLTHDDVWWAQLIDQCGSWVRTRIKRYEPGIGPVLESARSEEEQVRGYLEDDEPTPAARALGPMLERKLQDACEAFQAPVPYTVRNEHTLRPLLQYFVSRVKDKLGDFHPLVAAARLLEANTTFRNFSAHWKNPSSGLTVPEVREVLAQWLAIEGAIRCAKDECREVAAWDATGKVFRCSCGSLELRRPALPQKLTTAPGGAGVASSGDSSSAA